MKPTRTLVVLVVALGAAGGTVAAADTISAVVAPDGPINGDPGDVATMHCTA